MTNEPNEHGPPDWDVEAGGEDSADVAAPGQQRSFFSFGRCCGCLAIVGVFLVIGGLIAARMGLNIALPKTPIEVPRIEFSPEQAKDLETRKRTELDTGEIVTLTPEELTILIAQELQDDPKSRFHCAATADGLLDLRMSFHVSFLGERYFNVTCVGNITIEDEELTFAKLESFRLGEFVDLSELDESDSREWVERVRKGRRFDSEATTTLGRVKLFRFDGTHIEIQIEPD